MRGAQLRERRRALGWTQAELARRLGVSQPYVSLLESDARPVPTGLASRLVTVLDLPATALPLSASAAPLSPDVAAGSLNALGYEAFGHVRPARAVNPAELLVRTLRNKQVEARVVEALPWLLVRYPDLDWQWLVSNAKQHDLQNRLGFVVTLARELAERRDDARAAAPLRCWERSLEESKLEKEDSLAGEALTDAERRWLRTNRSPEAVQWNLLSNLGVEALTGA
jgi:transcriptional regulator with XRE-family HTH domain